MAFAGINFICGFNGGTLGSTSPAVTSAGTPSFISTGLADTWSDYAVRLPVGTAIYTNEVAQNVGATAPQYVGFIFRFSALPTSDARIAYDEGGSSFVSFYLHLSTTGKLLIHDYNDTLRGTGTATLSADTWYYIEIERELTDCRVYLNGDLDVNAPSMTQTSIGGRIHLVNEAGTGTKNFDYDSFYNAFSFSSGDRLGSWVIDALRHSNTTSSHERQLRIGSFYSSAALDTGTMDDTQETPWTSTAVTVTSTTDTDGYGGVSDCDGPSGQNYASNPTILALAYNVVGTGTGNFGDHKSALSNSTATYPLDTDCLTNFPQALTASTQFLQDIFLEGGSGTRCPELTDTLSVGFYKTQDATMSIQEVLAEAFIRTSVVPLSAETGSFSLSGVDAALIPPSGKGTLTLNNFWGAETAGLEDTNGNTGSGGVSAIAHSGSYAYSGFGAFASNYIEYDPFVSTSSAGTGIILGFWFRFSETVSGQQIVRLTDASANTDFRIKTGTTANTFQLTTSIGTVVATTAALSTDTYHLFEVYIERENSGAWAFYVDGESVGFGTDRDFDRITGTPVLRFSGAANDVLTSHWDDIYFMSGAISPYQRLGDSEVFAYRSSLNSATPDSGDALDTGTWLAIQSIPFAATAQASYTTDGKSGSVLTNDVGGSAGTGGPNTDANISGEIKAIKGVWECQLDTGTSYGILGSSTGRTKETPNLGDSGTLTPYSFVLSGAAYDLNQQIATGTTKSVSGILVDFSHDGMKLITRANPGGVATIYQYNLTTAWDISTASLNYTWTPSDFATNDNVGGATWSSDGSKIYVVNYANDRIQQYSCSTEYDLSTASYDSKTLLTEGNALPNQICLVNNDSTLFWADSGSDSVDRFTLTTPGDISTGQFDHSIVVDTNGTVFASVSDDGLNMLVEITTGASSGVLVQHRTTTAFDFTTNTEHARITGSRVYGAVWGDGGRRVIVAHGTTTVAEYSAFAAIPTASDYCEIGFGVSGGTSFATSGMLAMVLHSQPLAYEFEGYRFRDDDGSESGATWKAAQDTNITEQAGVNVRLRTLIDVTGDAPSEGVTLQYRKTGDPDWKDVQ